MDDDANTRILYSDILSEENYTPICAKDGEEALEVLRREEPDLVLLDFKLPGMDGIQVLERIRKTHSSLSVILISGEGDIESAVKAVKLGAYDFLEKPLDSDRLIVTVRNALWSKELQSEVKRLKDELSQRYRMIGNSQVMQELGKRILQAASNDAHVLITGETGAGKELVARAIHQASDRSQFPFIKVNCAAIPSDLVESELFGFCRGAFTGAHKDRKGRIEAAQGGTIFFDEIGELNPHAQAKLLYFLDSHSVERLGETLSRNIDARVVAATNRELTGEVGSKSFREDLYYRLNVIDIHVPPLREHPADIPEMVEYFLESKGRELGMPVKIIEESAIKKLMEYPWPGNIRELRNVVEKAFFLSEGITIHPEDLPKLIDEDMSVTGAEKLSLKDAGREFERRFIWEVLKAVNWNVAAAAERLEIDRTNLYRKIKALGIKKQPLSNPE